MKGKKLFAFILAQTILCSCVIGGCGKEDSNTSVNNGKMDKDQTLNIVGHDYTSLDPDVVDDSDSFTSLTNVYEGLMKEVIDKDGNSHDEPGGAEKVELSSDKLTYTFHLRKDAKWSDGKPVTASQYVYGWKRLINPETGSPYMSLLADINVKGAKEIIEASDKKADKASIRKLVDSLGVEAKDDYTFVVNLSKPTPFFTNVLSFKNLSPVREDKVKELGTQFGADPKKMVYNGPFIVSDYAKGSKIVYKKNDKYWNAKSVKLETANGIIVTEPTTMVKMFESKEIDVVNASKDDLDRLKQKSQSGEFKYVKLPMTRGNYDCINVTKPVLKNAKIRLALSLALNRQQYLDVVYKSYTPAMGFIGKGVSCGKSEFISKAGEPLKNVKDDPKTLFKEGMKEEGITDASKIKINLMAGVQASDTKATAEYMQKIYKETFGIDVNVEYTPDKKTYYKRIVDSDFDIYIGGWSPDYDDVSTFFRILMSNNSSNVGKYSNKEYDKLVSEADVEFDENKRIDLYKKAEDIAIAKDAALIPTYYDEVNQFRQNYVKDFKVPKYGANYDLSSVYVEGKEK